MKDPQYNPYDTYIEHRGRSYRYDPDYDCFYAASPRWAEPTVWDRYSPLIIFILLCIIALYIEYLR